VPTTALIVMLVDSTNGYYVQFQTRDLPAAARVLGIRVLVLNVATTSDIATAFASAVEQQAGAILIGGDPLLRGARAQIISLAARNAMPAMFSYGEAVTDGGLTSYGPDPEYRQLGIYASRILKGEKARISISVLCGLRGPAYPEWCAATRPDQRVADWPLCRLGDNPALRAPTAPWVAWAPTVQAGAAIGAPSAPNRLWRSKCPMGPRGVAEQPWGGRRKRRPSPH
jgi:hypothetical protein